MIVVKIKFFINLIWFFIKFVKTWKQKTRWQKTWHLLKTFKLIFIIICFLWNNIRILFKLLQILLESKNHLTQYKICFGKKSYPKMIDISITWIIYVLKNVTIYWRSHNLLSIFLLNIHNKVWKVLTLFLSINCAYIICKIRSVNVRAVKKNFQLYIFYNCRDLVS